MNEETPHFNEVVRYLKLVKVANTKALANMFNCSKRTIFRKLKSHRYLTSYNKNSSFLTLLEIPNFDNNGLWIFNGACFSRWETLEKTVQHVVSESQAGLTAAECKSLLHVNVYNHLTLNVKNNVIFCDNRSWRSVYYNIDKQIREHQQRERELIDKEKVGKKLHVPKDTIIKVLVLALKYQTTSIQQLLALLMDENVHVDEKVITWIFDTYQIKKKAFHYNFLKK